MGCALHGPTLLLTRKMFLRLRLSSTHQQRFHSSYSASTGLNLSRFTCNDLTKRGKGGGLIPNVTAELRAELSEHDLNKWERC